MNFFKNIKIQYRRTKQNFSKDKILNQNIVLRNKFQNKNCYILGNAPSINNHDLLKLQNESTFVVNSFFAHQDFDKIQPKFYVFADADLWNFEDPEISVWWNQLLDKSVNKEIIFFLPIELKNTFVAKKLVHEKVHFLDLSLPFKTKNAQQFDIIYPVNSVQNVLILCIQIAMYLGFSKIYLLGADHDWLSHFGNEQRHFYNSNSDEQQVQNVGSQGYPYNWWLNAVNTMFQQYKVVDAVANDKNIKIFNASESGLLDIYPQIRFLDTFTNR